MDYTLYDYVNPEIASAISQEREVLLLRDLSSPSVIFRHSITLATALNRHRVRQQLRDEMLAWANLQRRGRRR